MKRKWKIKKFEGLRHNEWGENKFWKMYSNKVENHQENF